MKVKPLALSLGVALAAGAAITASQPAAVASVNSQVYGPTSYMVAVTANIGRDYDRNRIVAEAMSRIKYNANQAADGRPKFIGWQEINEADSAPEMGYLKDIYRTSWGWDRTLYRKRPDGSLEPLKVPAVAHDAQKSGQRVKFGSSGMKGVSPRRLITVTRFSNQNISFINTHFIAGAFRSCGNCAERRKRWWTHWDNLKTEVAHERNDGFNVILTGDFNRRPVAGGWNPAKVHPSARHVKNGGIDHIVAVPRVGWKPNKPRYPNGSFRQGSWWIGIDGHRAHWVTVRFVPRQS